MPGLDDVATSMYEIARYGIKKYHDRKANFETLVELVREGMAVGVTLTDSEAQRFKDWLATVDTHMLVTQPAAIQSVATQLATSLVPAIANGAELDHLAESIARAVFEIHDQTKLPKGHQSDEWVENSSVKAHALVSALWPALAEVLTTDEVRSIRTELAVGALKDQIDSVLSELDWLHDNAVQLRQDLASDVPLERARLRPRAGLTLAPYQLLWAKNGIVPYVDFAGHLKSLTDWCENSERFSVQIVCGPGGTGKTRLGLELCVRMARRGWIAGKHQHESPRDLGALIDARLPRLIVVDYAEDRPGAAVALINALANQTPPRAHRIRIVLLVRRALDDPRKLFGGSQDDAGMYLSQREPLQIAPPSDGAAALTLEQRSELFNEATKAFALRFNTQPPPEIDLSDDTFRTPLFVCAAAVLRTDPNTANDPVPVTAEAILDELLRREETHAWSAVRRDGQLERPEGVPARHAVAIGTLFGADEKSEAVTHLSIIPELAQEVMLQNNTADWLHSLYEGERWVNPLEPDLLGEHLVRSCLDQATIEHAFAVVSTKSGFRAFTVLARCATVPAAAKLLKVPLSSHLQALTAAAFKQEADSVLWNAPGLLADPLAYLVELVHPDGQWTDPLHAIGPAGTRLAIAIGKVDTDRFRGLANGDPSPYSLALATSLSNLSNHLAEDGQWDEALQAINEATSIYRQLADGNPSTYNPDFAGSLNNLSTRLAENGQRNEALQAINEATSIYRQLADGNRSAYIPYLAICLNNLSTRLAENGQRDVALEAIHEAVALYRELAASDLTAYKPALAGSLINFSTRLAENGHRDEALKVIDDATTIYRDLVASNPSAYKPALAMSLNNLSNRLGEVGQQHKALQMIDEATTIYRDLAASNPSAYKPALAGSVNNLSNRLGEVGQLDEALHAIREATNIRRELAARNPSAYNPDLAISLNNFSNRLAAAGQHGEALQVIKQAITIYRDLAMANPQLYSARLATALRVLELLGPNDAVQENEAGA